MAVAEPKTDMLLEILVAGDGGRERFVNHERHVVVLAQAAGVKLDLQNPGFGIVADRTQVGLRCCSAHWHAAFHLSSDPPRDPDMIFLAKRRFSCQ